MRRLRFRAVARLSCVFPLLAAGCQMLDPPAPLPAVVPRAQAMIYPGVPAPTTDGPGIAGDVLPVRPPKVTLVRGPVPEAVPPARLAATPRPPGGKAEPWHAEVFRKRTDGIAPDARPSIRPVVHLERATPGGANPSGH